VIGKVLSAMKRRHSPRSFRTKQWKVQVVDVKVQDIEIVCALAHFVHASAYDVQSGHGSVT
jgi:hypothetical protein